MFGDTWSHRAPRAVLGLERAGKGGLSHFTTHVLHARRVLKTHLPGVIRRAWSCGDWVVGCRASQMTHVAVFLEPTRCKRWRVEGVGWSGSIKRGPAVLTHDHTRTEWGRMKVSASGNACGLGGYMRVSCWGSRADSLQKMVCGRRGVVGIDKVRCHRTYA